MTLDSVIQQYQEGAITKEEFVSWVLAHEVEPQLLKPEHVGERKTYIIANDDYPGVDSAMYSFTGTFKQLLEHLGEQPLEPLTVEETVELFNQANGDGQPYYMAWCVEDGKKVLG